MRIQINIWCIAAERNKKLQLKNIIFENILQIRSHLMITLLKFSHNFFDFQKFVSFAKSHNCILSCYLLLIYIIMFDFCILKFFKNMRAFVVLFMWHFDNASLQKAFLLLFENFILIYIDYFSFSRKIKSRVLFSTVYDTFKFIILFLKILVKNFSIINHQPFMAIQHLTWESLCINAKDSPRRVSCDSWLRL